MAEKTIIPKEIHRKEGTKEEIVFLQQENNIKNIRFIPMKSSEGRVEEIPEGEVAGQELPVFILLMNTFINAGCTATL